MAKVRGGDIQDAIAVLAAGAERAVLTASHAGAKLYPLVGYRELGTLLLYTPKKR